MLRALAPLALDAERMDGPSRRAIPSETLLELAEEEKKVYRAVKCYYTTPATHVHIVALVDLSTTYASVLNVFRNARRRLLLHEIELTSADPPLST